jgi:hypothetical protein
VKELFFYLLDVTILIPQGGFRVWLVRDLILSLEENTEMCDVPRD